MIKLFLHDSAFFERKNILKKHSQMSCIIENRLLTQIQLNKVRKYFFLENWILGNIFIYTFFV